MSNEKTYIIDDQRVQALHPVLALLSVLDGKNFAVSSLSEDCGYFIRTRDKNNTGTRTVKCESGKTVEVKVKYGI